ncbi:hypothetical protein ACFLZP_03335 [Patescibacteria group bacterium]
METLEVEKEKGEILKDFETDQNNQGKSFGKVLPLFLVIVFGSITGFFLSRRRTASSGLNSQKIGGKKELVAGSEAGSKDEKSFRDEAQGRLEKNDFSKISEGSHLLKRVGGESQTAYLTSSILNLDDYLGTCVQVWAETYAGQEVGWLMDVGRIKVLKNCPEGL